MLVAPCGRVVNVDSKLWSARGVVRLGRGRLWHGQADRTAALGVVLHESRLVSRAVGARVETVVVVHNAPMVGGGLAVDGLLPLLRSLAGRPDPGRARAVAERATAVLPRYREGG
ncbi:hypothetical protein ACFW9F_25390 [Streptomyces sp. NPDC059506]|uniref:hypothetical protein n=1 Tax=Streptomyces sp. NPDC059506 TaxID=3347751 RepID=UPI0036AE6738